MKALVCIDVQNDFVSGHLGSPAADGGRTSEQDGKDPVETLISRVCMCSGRLDIVEGGTAEAHVALCQDVRMELMEAVEKYRSEQKGGRT